MDWMNQLSGVLQQYNAAGAARARTSVHDDFDQIAQGAPQSALADGLAAAFRSDETPEFGKMAGQLFNNSDGEQRAGILNTLLRTAGPLILSQILSRQTQPLGGGGFSNLIDLLKGGNETEVTLKGGNETEVTPEQAEQIPAGAVEEIAAQAEKKDPSVIDQVSKFYAEHPTLVKTLGAAALTIALSQIAKRQQG